MIEASMKDIPSDESISGDEDDPELLDELSEITGGVLHIDHNIENTHLIIGEQPLLSDTVEDTRPIKPIGTQQQLLVERLSMYKEAANKALSDGESARARRFNRGVKTLGDLIKQVASGKSISEEDIPPPLASSTSSTISIPTEPVPPSESLYLFL
uniref:DM14 domain-containing protein n=1 Tax=Clastoptera arizonana TaxID=38151 RepID=A0A1B6D241_9HEMI